MVILRRVLDWLARYFAKLKAADATIAKLQADKRLVEARLAVCRAAKQVAIDSASELSIANVGLKAEVEDLKAELAPPDPPSYLEEIDRMLSEVSLREIFGNCLLYGLDDNVNDIPPLSDTLAFFERAGIYLADWLEERRDCDNFTRAGKGRLAMAPGWGGVIALDIQFERPIPPFGTEFHSELLMLCVDDRDADRVWRWFVFELQENRVYADAAIMFAPGTGNRVTLIK